MVSFSRSPTTRRKQEISSLVSVKNIFAFVLLVITLGRLAMVIRSNSTRRAQQGEDGSGRVPMWVPVPAKPVQEEQAWLRRRKAADAIPANKRARLGAPEPHRHTDKEQLWGSNVGGYSVGVTLPRRYESYERKELNGCSSSSVCWGKGMKVLIFTMDSLSDRVELAARGGPAGEIKIRESLSKALEEAGVEVEIAVSDLDFERRAGEMDLYDALVLDPWTWAGKGWRLKPQLRNRQHKMFILDFFGADKPHHNMGVPLVQHLTAFPVPPEQSRTFLGYQIDPSDVLTGVLEKKRQGVIWGKTAASFKGPGVEQLVLKLASVVELHSTVALKDAIIIHKNIVYHGILTKEEWRRLLQESKFMIGLGDPLAGPSAVDAVVAGCSYLNPIYRSPVKSIYRSQHPFLEETVGEPHVCSFHMEDIDSALACAEKALELDLDPMLPEELTRHAHNQRVRNIFEPMHRDHTPPAYPTRNV